MLKQTQEPENSAMKKDGPFTERAHIDLHANGDDQRVVIRIAKRANPNKMLILNYVRGTNDAFAIECTDIGLVEYVACCLESTTIIGPYTIKTNFGLHKTVTTLDETMLLVKDYITQMMKIDVLIVLRRNADFMDLNKPKSPRTTTCKSLCHRFLCI